MNLRPLAYAVLMLSFLATSGCGIRIGPVVETRYVILKPGQPGRVMENVTVPMSSLGHDEIAPQDIGGWVVMPPEHWAAVMRALQPGVAPTDRID